jgi:Tfp pilus assembly major pilin PilA
MILRPRASLWNNEGLMLVGYFCRNRTSERQDTNGDTTAQNNSAEKQRNVEFTMLPSPQTENEANCAKSTPSVAAVREQRDW